MNDTKNLLLAIAISLGVLFGFHYFYERPQRLNAESAVAHTAETTTQQQLTKDAVLQATRQHPLPENSPRIPIDTPKLKGTLRLIGAVFDDLVLKNYRTEVDATSAPITLLAPDDQDHPYAIHRVWSAKDSELALPNDRTLWTKISGDVLTPETPLVLRWESPQKLIFERRLSIDDDYLVTVTDRVTNNSGRDVQLSVNSTIVRRGEPETSGYFILHEGPVGVFNGRLFESKYSDLKDGQVEQSSSTGGWIGIADKYWLTALIPNSNAPVSFTTQGRMEAGKPAYSVAMESALQTVTEGVTLELTERIFVGAKELELLDRYAKEHGIARFDLAVDFGWFYFLTKPIFYALEFFHEVLGNFGLSILLLTVCIKLILFPLANKSYRSMAKMRLLQPELVRLKETYAEDRLRQHTEMMNLYKKHQVNPLAGCLPIIIQIPVFFALYKVLFISIEMRHAPFYGWIQDLSAPDPTTLFNLFGLIPWAPPAMLMVGAWPIIMGITMFLQQKLSPQPADPIQARVFLFMPLMFTFFLSQFAVGLVIYWAWNNLLSIAQQWFIMRAESQRNEHDGGPSGGIRTTSKAKREAKRAAAVARNTP